jgi:two-component system response regulator DevR
MREARIGRVGGLSMSVPADQYQVVLFDRQPLWLDALEQFLRRSGIEVAGKSTTPEGALATIAETLPDVFVSEVERQPGEASLSTIRGARELHPGIRTVVLGTSDDPGVIESAFRAGADVYCIKTAVAEDLLSAIRQALRHSIFVAAATSLTPSPPLEKKAVQALDALTKRELEILRLVSEGHTNLQLARMLWVTEQTVKFHLSNIYRKLEVSNRTEASRWAQTHGLLPSVRENPAAATAA